MAQALSWKAEVIADNSGKWCSNQLRFATEPEARDYAADLAWRWTAVRDRRVIEDNEPVNAVWREGRARHLRGPDTTEQS